MSFQRHRVYPYRLQHSYRYYSAISQVQRPSAAIDVTDTASAEKYGFLPRSSRDTALTAFAQLGALRLNASRALISLIDSKTQYILAEATRSLSLQSDTRHDQSDSLWLGAVAIPSRRGICGFMLDGLQRGGLSESGDPLPEVLVINDMREVGQFAQCSWVVSGPQILHAVGVPLLSSDGTKVGMFTICGEKPRPDLAQDQKSFLQDMAKTIMNHLDAVRIQAEYRRRDRLINGLESFVDGLAEVRTSIVGANRHTSKTQKGVRIAQKDADADEKLAERDEDDLETPRSQQSGASSKDSQSLWESALPPGSKSMFSRASKIIRQAGDYDGVVFFWASSNPRPGGRNRREILLVQGGRRDATRRYSTSSISSRTSTDDYSDSQAKASRESGFDASLANDQEARNGHHGLESTPCPVLGYSLNDSEVGAQAANDYTFAGFTQRHLRTVFGNKPKGRVFVLNDQAQALAGDDSNTESGIEQALSAASDTAKSGTETEVSGSSRKWRVKRKIRRLLELSPAGRSFTTLPLYDFERERWFAYCICWSSTANRDPGLDGDLHYLRIFGNSIMNALSHIDALAADRAKTSFVASVSHELRSPLHGILGANNFLSDSQLTRFQEEMVDSIQSCGRTLLDTLDHVMDFAKINSFSNNEENKALRLTKRSINRRPSNLSEQHGLMNSPVNLSTLVEEVVEAIAMGYTVQHDFLNLDEKAKYGLLESPSSKSGQDDNARDRAVLPQRGRVRVALELAYPHNLHLQTRPGAWRRIVMNLFANALKYTSDGLIIVRLEAAEDLGNKDYIKTELTVKDTGRGISNDYLQNHLFRPFSQEDPFTPGTGLGLSIVSQIVRQMGGTVDVSSSKGNGTTMKLIVSMPRSDPPSSIAQQTDFASTITEQMRGMKLCLLEDTASRASVNLNVVQRTSESRYSQILLKLLQDWFKADASISDTWAPQAADIVICLEPSFKHLANIRKQVSDSQDAPPVIFIAYDTLEMAALRADARITSAASTVEIICQP